MIVQIDISANLKQKQLDSYLGVASIDGVYRRSILLSTSVKKQIKNFSKRRAEIHAVLIYLLINAHIEKYSAIQICQDTSKNKLHNNLQILFNENEHFSRLTTGRKIRFKAVGHSNCVVHDYVTDLRKRKGEATIRVFKSQLTSTLNFLDRDVKKPAPKIR